MENRFGVYIGEQIEAVVTPVYTLVYRKNTPNNSMDAYLLDTNTFSCLGICRCSPIPTKDCGFTEFKFYSEEPGTVEYALRVKEADPVISNGSLSAYLQKKIMDFRTDGNNALFTFGDGMEYRAVRHEDLSRDGLTPSQPDAEDGSIALCLQQWILGVSEQKENGRIVGVEVNTPRHMYIFHITESFIYCRAARYAVCERGVVFSQNFRLNRHAGSGGQMAFFENNTIAMKELHIREELFDPNTCVFHDVDIYWSVASVEKNRIKLHGCGGDIYTRVQPQI